MNLIRGVDQHIIPILVGLTSLMLLDNTLGNVNSEMYALLKKSVHVRFLLLFGAAYASNGCRFWPAVIATYAYSALWYTYKEMVASLEALENTTDTPTTTHDTPPSETAITASSNMDTDVSSLEF